MPPAEPPRVFISYSHDSEEHKDRVLALAERLREDGIDCEIDQYEEAPAEGWPRWMQDRLAWADHVLVVCTAPYAARFQGRGEPGRGKGAKWEGAIVTQEIYDAEGRNTKFIPVLINAADLEHVPTVLRPATWHVLSSEDEYERLYRRLTGQPLVTRRAVGALRKMPARERRPLAPWAAPEPAAPTSHAASEAERTAARRGLQQAGDAESSLERETLLALLECTRALNEKDTLDELLTEILAFAGRLTDADAGSVILHDPDAGDLYIAAATGPKRDEVLGLRVPIAGSKAGSVYATGSAIVEHNVVGHFNAVDQRTHFTTHSMICIPLEHRDRRFGVIQLLNKREERPFDERDVELLARFGQQASIALQKARLLDQMIGSSGLYARPDVRGDLVRLLGAPGRIALRERVTVLTVDMRRFTLLSERIASPETVQALLSDYVSGLGGAAVAQGGIVHKVAGDGLVALFRANAGAGAAAQAAFDMSETFDALLGVWRGRVEFSLDFVDLGIGIATDDVILGTVGNDRFRDFTVIGGAINLAATLVKCAEGPDRVLCDLTTYAAISGEPWLQADGPRQIWPKHDPRHESRPYEVYSLRRR
jgi:class 3 adenylate cyclase